MDPRPIAAVTAAARHTRRLLFGGWSAQRWLYLAFAAWLAHLGSGGMRFRVPGAPRPSMGVPAVDETWSELWPWMALALGVLVLVGLFALGLWVAVVYLNARGAFLFVEMLVRDASTISRSWRRHGALADDLFLFRVRLGLAYFAAVGIPCTVGALAVGGWSWWAPETPLLVPVAGGLLALCLLVALQLTLLYRGLLVLLYDLVVPIMYVRRVGVRTAARSVASLLLAHPRMALRYAAVRTALGAGAAAAGLTVGGLLWMFGSMPVVDAVILVPVLVFVRSFSMHFAARLAPDLAVLDLEAARAA